MFLKVFYFYLFLERGREGERQGKKHQCVVVSCMPPTGDLACNPGMCPDWELNQLLFGSQVHAQSTEPHQPGLKLYIYSHAYHNFGIQINICFGVPFSKTSLNEFFYSKSWSLNAEEKRSPQLPWGVLTIL